MGKFRAITTHKFNLIYNSMILHRLATFSIYYNPHNIVKLLFFYFALHLEQTKMLLIFKPRLLAN
jgi:hypothetical protein